VVRGLALFLLFTFALCRLEPTRLVQLTVEIPKSSIRVIQGPAEPRFTLDRTVARTSVVVQSRSHGEGVLDASVAFSLVDSAPATEFVHPSSSARRLVDRRALIRQLGRVQDRSTAPPSA
jgi:hypothetical protein